MSVQYIENERITAAKQKLLWWQKQGLQETASGYGRKLRTSYMVQVDGKKWHRVYCVCFSNAGSIYVIVGGQTLYIRDEYHVQDLAKLN